MPREGFPQAFLPRPGTSNVHAAPQKFCHNVPTGFPRIVRGRTGKTGVRWAVMRRVSNPLFAVIFLAGLALLFALPQAAHAVSMIRISDSSLCVDSMETDPDSDDLQPILADVDEGCMIQTQDTISI